MGTTNKVYLINKTLTEDCRVFVTLKTMVETFNAELEKSGVDEESKKAKRFNYESLRSLKYKVPEKYNGYTIRRTWIERSSEDTEKAMKSRRATKTPRKEVDLTCSPEQRRRNRLDRIFNKKNEGK